VRVEVLLQGRGAPGVGLVHLEHVLLVHLLLVLLVLLVLLGDRQQGASRAARRPVGLHHGARLSVIAVCCAVG